MKILKKINLLDCTLRDGGYYNNWDFSSTLVNEYLKTMSKVGIEYVELGFRSFQSSTFRGSNWYTTDNYINSLKIPSNLKIVVMVNASQIINQKNLIKSIKILFNPKKKSKVSLVRIACHFAEIEKTLVIVKQLKILGYNVAVNLAVTGDNGHEWVLLWDNGSVKTSDGTSTAFNWMESFQFENGKIITMNQFSKPRN